MMECCVSNGTCIEFTDCLVVGEETVIAVTCIRALTHGVSLPGHSSCSCAAISNDLGAA